MPPTFEALAVVLIAVVPGTVARAAWSRGKTYQRPSSDIGLVIQAIVLSLVIQAVLFPVTAWILYPYRTHLDAEPVRVAVWLFLTAILVPLVGGYVTGRIADALADEDTDGLVAENSGWRRQWTRLRRDLRPMAPSAFDWLADRRIPDPSVVVVTFNDGTIVGGLFAEGAVFSTSPQSQGMYLPVEVVLDGDGEPVGVTHDRRGVLIPDLANVRNVRILPLDA